MIDQPFRTTEPSTRPQMPQERRNRSPWPWLMFGMLLVAAVYLLREEPATTAPAAPAVMASQPAPPTVVMQLELPAVETMTTLLLTTPSPTAIPTARPTPAATFDVSVYWCSNVTPRAGVECQGDPAPTATAIPRPDCPPKNPGQWCQWRNDPETGTEVETR
jgi:hypothetical protein